MGQVANLPYEAGQVGNLPHGKNRRRMAFPSLIFLIGYRGTGKSTVACEIARRRGWQWADADAVLEQRFGRSIAQIFAEEGESGFRDKETTILDELSSRREHVIATGGGVILRAENRARIKAAGFAVWLTADPATIWQRLQADAATAGRRPALTVGGLAEVEELLRLREPLYRSCADLTVSTVGRSPEEIATEIEARLEALR